ncbi:MAG: hypothetical protein ACR2PL_03365 [Dehalococcoidia bacterium]
MIGSLSDLEAAWKETDREQNYWAEHFGTYEEEYLEQFVAVAHREVVANDADLENLITALEAKGYKPSQVWIRFFSKQPVVVVL